MLVESVIPRSFRSAAHLVSCPTDATLARFFEQTLSPSAHQALLAHATSCDLCDVILTLLSGRNAEASGGGEADASLDRFVRRTHLAQRFREGVSVGRFRILRPLGQGAMGMVYAAHDPQLRRDVALKVLLDESTDRLLDEARSMARLSHPNIVTVFEVGIDERSVFLTMQLVDGTTLAEWLRTSPTRKQILGIFSDVARALEAAHRAGVVHRDLKPQNVLVSKDGVAKVTDFGLASVSVLVTEDGGTDGAAEGTQGAVGTPAYMAPEVAMGGPVGAAADQFSFGVCLHEALTGRRPHEGDSFGEIRASLASNEPNIDASIPLGLQRLLARCLARAPRERFSSMADIADLLLAASTEDGHKVPRPRRARAQFAILGFAAFVVLAGGFIIFERSRPSTQFIETLRRTGPVVESSNRLPEVSASTAPVLAENADEHPVPLSKRLTSTSQVPTALKKTAATALALPHSEPTPHPGISSSTESGADLVAEKGVLKAQDSAQVTGSSAWLRSRK